MPRETTAPDAQVNREDVLGKLARGEITRQEAARLIRGSTDPSRWERAVDDRKGTSRA